MPHSLLPDQLQRLRRLASESASRYAAGDADRVHQARSAAAVMALLAPGDEGTELLFTLRARHLKSHPGEVSLPGGNREPEDKSLYHTALRETREETGLRAEPEFLGALSPLRARSGIPVMPYVSMLPDKPVLRASPDEVDELFWVPVSALLGQTPRYREYDRHGQSVQIPFYDYENWTIWGMTGLVVAELLTVVRGNTRS